MLTEQPILITSIQCKEPGGALKNRFIDFDGTFGSEGAKSLGVCKCRYKSGEMIPVLLKALRIVVSR